MPKNMNNAGAGLTNRIRLLMCILASFGVVAISAEGPRTTSFYFLPGVKDAFYSQLGDVNVGGVALAYQKMESTKACTATVKERTTVMEIVESIAFAVEVVNQNPHLLPNVTMGFVVRGTCTIASQALATSLLFLPRAERVCNGRQCYTRRMNAPPPETPWLTHDVIGLVGTSDSTLTLPVSTLYASASVPIVGSEESSDDLSNKNDHPYFFRIGPPDRYQVDAMLQFVSENGWSYISVLYREGSYGEMAFKTIEKRSSSYGICLATSHVVSRGTDYDKVVKDLYNHPRARVVLVVLTGSRFYRILRAARKFKVEGHFIWILADSRSRYRGYDSHSGHTGVFDRSTDPAIGAFTFEVFFTYVNDFYYRLRDKNPKTSTNPWLQAPFEHLLGCSYDNGTCGPDADILSSERFMATKASSMTMDAVLAYAHAAHHLLAENCPHARGREARDCITRELFYNYLKNVDFEGNNGRIRFDENQDVKGKYLIGQIVYDYETYPFSNNTKQKRITRKYIGVYDTSTQTIEHYNNPIRWSHLTRVDRVVPWTNGSLPIHIPESVCSRPCLLGEYRIEKEVPCCWECRRCRDNERLVKANTSCELCPAFTWPDPESGLTTCLDIPPTFQELHDVIPLAINSLAVVLLAATSFVVGVYFRFRNERVIKASSKELSVLQLVAIFTGYLTTVLLQAKPSHTRCALVFFTFCGSFSLLYCPLLVKTMRIYRIFQSGAKNEKPRFISPQSQLTLSGVLISIQVILCVVTFILFRPRARLTQPIWTEKMVELSCDFTFPGLTSFLGYNIVLVLFCSVLAFMVRKLPDNFNESKFISMCVSTTLLIWLAFVPTYFTADREYIRAFLLSMALVLNHSVALFTLFVPKIYVAIFVSTEDGKFSGARS